MDILEEASDSVSLGYIIYDIENVLSYRTMRFMKYDYVQHHRRKCGCEFCLADISTLKHARGVQPLRKALIAYLREVHEKRAGLADRKE